MLIDKLKETLQAGQLQVAKYAIILDEIVTRLEAVEKAVLEITEKSSKQAVLKVDNTVKQVDSTLEKSQSKLEQATAKKVIEISERLSKIEKVFGNYGK